MKLGRLSRVAAVVLTSASIAPLSLAVDGTREISQACASGPGCFSGDSAGFPITISQPGSYVLTSDLDAPDINATAIYVETNDVHLDLNGFIVRGVAGCLSEGGCPAGSGGGIIADVTEWGDRVTIRDGGVQGFGSDGIVLRDHAFVSNMTVSNLQGDGIQLRFGGRLTGNRVAAMLGTGLSMGTNTLFDENSIRDFGSGGAGPSIANGLQSGTNHCYDGLCPPPIPTVALLKRRFYRTTQGYDGSEAADPENCATGFHFASIFELWDPTNLQYDHNLGTTSDDAGDGPPTGLGTRAFMRTGLPSAASSGGGVLANCEIWSVTTGSGTAMWLDENWDDVQLQISPWERAQVDCFQDKSIWCVED